MEFVHIGTLTMVGEKKKKVFETLVYLNSHPERILFKVARKQ